MGAENRRLAQEVASLRERLGHYEDNAPQTPVKDSLLDGMGFEYMAARVLRNSVNRAENFMTIDKGTRDGVVPDMAVISGGAVAGYILESTERFSKAVSIINTGFRTSGKILGKDNSSGSVSWDARSYDEVVLSEMPKYADIEIGDTIVTTQYSPRFPEGMLIGTVADFELVNGTYYEVRVRLALQMGALYDVVLARNEDMEERRSLENELD